MAWDGFQREVLAALGHQLYAVADAAPAAPSVQDAPPLLRALARAVGSDVATLPALPPLDQLRTPAAKRALWPRLRALRSARRRDSGA
jgi:hypothetical protein